MTTRIHIHVGRTKDAGTAHDPSNGQFAAGSASSHLNAAKGHAAQLAAKGANHPQAHLHRAAIHHPTEAAAAVKRSDEAANRGASSIEHSAATNKHAATAARAEALIK